jgi:hypothetical protein
MAPKNPDKSLIDNGGRRKETDRRNFSYSAHIPERRSGDDRREGQERRTKKRVPEDDQIQPNEEHSE